MTASPSVVDEARRLLDLNVAIVAVKADKKPLGKGWRRRFTDEEVLERLKHPAVVAIGFLGGDLNSGIVPVDFDSAEGESWWQQQCAGAGLSPDAFPTVLTPGKIQADGSRRPGKHRYVKDIRGTLGNSEGDLVTLDINVRGAGHAMLPPSPHPDGGHYEWAPGLSLYDFAAIPPCPDFLYAAIERDKGTAPAPNGQASRGSLHTTLHGTAAEERQAQIDKYVAIALAGETANVRQAPVGNRNKALNIAALKLGHLVGADYLTRRRVEQALYAAAQSCGLVADDGEKSVHDTIKSGLDKGITEPREVPDLPAAQQSTRTKREAPRPAVGIINAADLDGTTFAAPAFIVPGYITEGLSLLAGRPKIGKSWLALGVADAVARGGKALGSIQVEGGDVLYLALEDTQRRLQMRLRAIRQDAAPSPRLHLATHWDRLDEGGLDKLAAWLADHPGARLIVVDVLARVRGKPPARDVGIYQADYQAVTDLKALADRTRVGILALHHLRKSTSDDPLEEVSGSTGLTGAVDSVLVLKRDRANADAVLFATGRDIEEIESALHFDRDTGRWSMLGTAADFRKSQERRAITELLRNTAEPMTPKEVAEALGRKPATVKMTLKRMFDDCQILRIGTGLYTVPPDQAPL